jgi:hypothetical protein
VEWHESAPRHQRRERARSPWHRSTPVCHVSGERGPRGTHRIRRPSGDGTLLVRTSRPGPGRPHPRPCRHGGAPKPYGPLSPVFEGPLLQQAEAALRVVPDAKRERPTATSKRRALMRLGRTRGPGGRVEGAAGLTNSSTHPSGPVGLGRGCGRHDAGSQAPSVRCAGRPHPGDATTGAAPPSGA